MEQNQAYVITGTAYKKMTLELLEQVKLAEDIGDKKKRIGIKPNLVVPKTADSGATTHPELVDGVITYLKQKGFENLVVLEGSWVGDLTSEAVRVNGIYEVCQRQGVPFIDLQKDGAVTREAEGMELHICKETAALDYLINLPVLKGHCQTTITCALKNAKGLIPNQEKRRFHTLGLHKPIAYLNAAIRQDFILVDNICGDLDFEEGGNPVVMNRLLAFKDPVLCDSYAAESMGYRPEEISYIAIANEIGVGSSDTSRLELIDLNREAAGLIEKQDAKTCAENPQIGSHTGSHTGMPPHSRKVAKLAQYVAPKDACSACYGSLIYALDRLQQEGVLQGKEKSSVSIGQGYRGESGTLGIGQCTRCFEKSLKGCPPKAVDIAEYLRKEWK